MIKIRVCGKCGSDKISRVGDDCLDYCKDCGVIEDCVNEIEEED